MGMHRYISTTAEVCMVHGPTLLVWWQQQRALPVAYAAAHDDGAGCRTCGKSSDWNERLS
jgi:hypothetical protein